MVSVIEPETRVARQAPYLTYLSGTNVNVNYLQEGQREDGIHNQEETIQVPGETAKNNFSEFSVQNQEYLSG